MVPTPIPKWLVLPVLAGVLGMAVAGLVLRVPDMWPLDVHLRDDAYYYFVWASNLASGAGPCVSEGIPTSGVHLLWGLSLTLVSALGLALPAASVWLGLGLHLLTAVVLVRAAAPDWRLGVLVGSCYLGSPSLCFEAMNGQETALACLALAAFLIAYQRSVRWFFGLALVLVLARSDLIFLVGGLALAQRGLRRQRLMAVAAVVLCYAGVNLLLAGHWLQDSAEPMPWLMAEEHRHAGTSLWSRWQPQLRWLALGVPFRNASTPLALALLLVAMIGLRRRRWEWPCLLLAGLGLAAFHALWREYPRDYYFAPLGVLGALGLLRLAQWNLRLGFAVVVLAGVWNGLHLADRAPTRNWQREMSLAGRFVDRLMPASARIGCFNSGIVTWERAGPVLNLDGVVNRGAYRALRSRRLLAYLLANNVSYLLDNPVQFAMRGVHSNGRYFGGGFRAAEHLQEVARFIWPERPDGRRPGMDGFRLYRLRRVLVVDEPRRPLAADLGPAPGGRLVMWSGRAGQRLRDATQTLVHADLDTVYVLQLPWDGRNPLRLYVDAVEQPVLTIAPD